MRRYKDKETQTLDTPEKAVMFDPRVKYKKRKREDSHGKSPHFGGFFNALKKEKSNG